MQPHPHLLKKPQVFLNTAIPIRRRDTLSSFSSHLIHGLSTDIGITLLDELHCEGVELCKILRGVGDLNRLVSHEMHVLYDVIYKLLILFGGIGVVKAQVAPTVVEFGLHEIETHGFAVPDVKVAVRLRWESS